MLNLTGILNKWQQLADLRQNALAQFDPQQPFDAALD